MGHLRANDSTHGGDLDPGDATSVAEFAAYLRQLRVNAGNPSLRDLETWGRRNGTELPRSTVAQALAGARLPRRDVVTGFVRACGVPATDKRWEAVRARLAGAGRRPLSSGHPVSRDLSGSGLLRIGSRYLSDMEWKQLFAEVTELDIVVAYGRTWRNLYARELAAVAARPQCRIRVVLGDPDDEFTIRVLADRFDVEPTDLQDRITTARSEYERLRQPDGATLDIYYRRGDLLFSFYRFDDVAVVGLFSHSRSRASAVPVFVCTRPGELYEFIDEELKVIVDQSRLV